jgi:ABC-2 type transport system permease protein
MLSSYRLFLRRMLSDWSYQYRTIRTAVDWTVAIYLVIPGLLVAGYHYASWWREAPGWFGWIPYSIVLVVFYLFAWSGTIRFFVEEGDQLFLRQNQTWFSRLMRYGWRYSLLLQGVTSLLLLAIFLPLLINGYSISVMQVISLLVLTYLFKINLGLVRQLLAIHLMRLSLWLARFGIMICSFFIFRFPAANISSHPVFSWISCALLLILLACLSQVRLKQKGTFFADIAREGESRMKLASLMLIGIVKKKRSEVRKRPLLFSKSQRLFRGETARSGLSDLLAKSFFRNSAQWMLTIQFVAVASAAEFILPVPLKIAAWLLLAFLLTLWRKAYCKEVLTASFLKLFNLEDTAKHQALQAVTPILVLPALILISLCAGLSLWIWWGPLLLLAAAVPVAYGISSLVTSWY